MCFLKAIKDGVIEATINHHEGYMQSKVHNITCELIMFYCCVGTL